MEYVQSADRTRIAFDRHSTNSLEAGLSSSFTVHQYDRRGRDDRTNVAPYAVERELKGLRAVIEAAGGESADWAREGAQLIAASVQRGEFRALAGQGHCVEDDVLIPVLTEFFV